MMFTHIFYRGVDADYWEGALSRPKASSSTSSTQSTGYRIVVSNLQANVTQEDIKVQYNNLFFLIPRVCYKVLIKSHFIGII